MKSLNRRLQAGDTLVEVLIAIAVMSSVLGITYAIMNQNLTVMRDNQERTEAVKIAQAQIESLKNASAINDPIFNAQMSTPGTPPFCFDPAGNLVDMSGSTTPQEDVTADVAADYPDPQCRRQGIYRVGVDYIEDFPLFFYKVYVRWDRIGGGRDGGTAEVVLVYQLE